jgi:hypothetical protein
MRRLILVIMCAAMVAASCGGDDGDAAVKRYLSAMTKLLIYRRTADMSCSIAVTAALRRTSPYCLPCDNKGERRDIDL